MKIPLRSWSALQIYTTRNSPQVQAILKEPLPLVKEETKYVCSYQSPCTVASFPTYFHLKAVKRQGKAAIITLELEYDADEIPLSYSCLVQPRKDHPTHNWIPNYHFSIKNRDWLTCIVFMLEPELRTLF